MSSRRLGLSLGFLLVACSGAGEDVAPAGSGGNGAAGGVAGADASLVEGGNWSGAAGVSGTSATGGAAGSVEGGSDAPAVQSCTTSAALNCGDVSPASYACGDPAPTFAKEVNAALELVLAQNPSWFDESQGSAPCCPLSLMPTEFMNAVVSAINAAGLCAKLDPNNPAIEIVVKHDESCSEQYVLLTSANIVRHPPKFQGTCSPAWL